MKNLTLRQLRFFISAAKHQSFSRAAEECHVTVPAVSLQIKELESEVGYALFTRAQRRVSLTPAGEHFLVYALKVQSTLEQAQQSLDELQGIYMGSLNIGLVSTTRYFFPHILAEFQKQHPQVQLKLDVKNRAQLIEQLHAGDIDLAIMGKPPSTLSAEAYCFATHPHVFIAHPHHLLAKMKQVSAQMLNNEEIITREQGSGTRYIMEQFFNKHHLSPKMRIEISGNETIKQAVIADLGISLVSIHTINQEIKNQQLRILNIEDTPILRDWYVVMPQHRPTTKASTAFRTFMLEQAETLLSQLFKEVNQTIQAPANTD